MIKKPDTDEDDAFLSRWAKRKEAVREQDAEVDVLDKEEDIETPTTTEVTPPATGRMITTTEDHQPLGSSESEIVLTDEDMPPIESLNDQSDFSAFMSPGVSESLRKLALRKLFAGVGFNVRDGLDDYDDDFTNFPPLGDIITSDMKHQIELAEKRKQEAEEQAALAEQEEADEELDAAEEDGEDEMPDDDETDARQPEEIVNTDDAPDEPEET